MADVLKLDHYRPHNPSNGAREALIDGITMAPDLDDNEGSVRCADFLLAWL